MKEAHRFQNLLVSYMDSDLHVAYMSVPINKNTSRFVLAVDGGQSHSVAVVADLQGNVLSSGTGGPANHYLETGGPQRFRQSMHSCISGAISAAHQDINAFAASYYCLTGVHADIPAVLQQIAPSQQQVIAGDREAALAGATQQRPAVLVLAGTGSISYGLCADGRDDWTGGWGYIMGDEGSAAWIALRALSAATQAADGRAGITALSDMIPEYYGVNTLRELHPLIYQHAIDRARLAEIASVVGGAAAQGDQVAMQIITDAAIHLGNTACAVIHALHIAGSNVTVTSAGGVFKAGDLLIAPMMDRIQRVAPAAVYQAPVYPPIIGAVILALQSIGIAVTGSVLANIEASRSMWQNLK